MKYLSCPATLLLKYVLKNLSPVVREENVVTHEQLAFGCVGANLTSVWLPLPQLWRSMVDHNLTGVALS